MFTRYYVFGYVQPQWKFSNLVILPTQISNYTLSNDRCSLNLMLIEFNFKKWKNDRKPSRWKWLNQHYIIFIRLYPFQNWRLIIMDRNVPSGLPWCMNLGRHDIQASKRQTVTAWKRFGIYNKYINKECEYYKGSTNCR